MKTTIATIVMFLSVLSVEISFAGEIARNSSLPDFAFYTHPNAPFNQSASNKFGQKGLFALKRIMQGCIEIDLVEEQLEKPIPFKTSAGKQVADLVNKTVLLSGSAWDMKQKLNYSFNFSMGEIAFIPITNDWNKAGFSYLCLLYYT